MRDRPPGEHACKIFCGTGLSQERHRLQIDALRFVDPSATVERKTTVRQSERQEGLVSQAHGVGDCPLTCLFCGFTEALGIHADAEPEFDHRRVWFGVARRIECEVDPAQAFDAGPTLIHSARSAAINLAPSSTSCFATNAQPMAARKLSSSGSSCATHVSVGAASKLASAISAMRRKCSACLRLSAALSPVLASFSRAYCQVVSKSR